MAARLWRWVLGCELALAAVVAAGIGEAWQLSAAEALALAAAIYLITQFALVSASFLLAHGAARDLRACSLRQSLRALCTETYHFGVAQLLMCAEPHLGHRDVQPPADRRSARPVLLIHGLACNRGVWRALIGALRAAGFAPIRAINLEPLFTDIEFHTAGVERALRTMQRQCEGARVAIVAHSMGGLIARAALRSAGPTVIGQIITLGSPHHGTSIACRVRLQPVRQMCPGSPFLRRLNAPQDPTTGIAFTSLYSPEDNLVAPAGSAVVEGAESKALRGMGHFALLRANIDRVVAVLQRGSRA